MRLSSVTRRDFLKVASITSIATLGISRQGKLPPWFSTSEPLNSPMRSPLKSVNMDYPNVLLIIFDALSARNMALYGYPRQNTPNIENFAARSIVYHQHHSSGNFTSPGTGSLLTGVYPWYHRALQQRTQTLERYGNRNIFSLFPKNYFRFSYTQNPFTYSLLDLFRDDIQLLPRISDLAEYNALFTEDYLQQDYFIATEAEVLSLKQETHQPASLFLSMLEKLRIGRDNRALAQEFRKTYPMGLTNCRATNPGVQCFELEKAIDWSISQVKSTTQPFFGYLHYFPPHSPYNPRADFMPLFKEELALPKKPPFPGATGTNPKAMRNHRRRYDQSIAHVDSEFGRLISSLKQAGILDNTVVIFTSDHGEMFERNVLGHGTPSLYEPIMHIPLLLSLPGQQSRLDVNAPTNNVDMLPTILSLVGVEHPADDEGIVLPLSDPTSLSFDRSIYTVEAKSSPKRGPLNKATFALLHWPFKLIQYQGYGNILDGYELYNLFDDPEEMADQYSPDDPTSRQMKQELQEKLVEVKAVPT